MPSTHNIHVVLKPESHSIAAATIEAEKPLDKTSAKVATATKEAPSVEPNPPAQVGRLHLTRSVYVRVEYAHWPTQAIKRNNSATVEQQHPTTADAITTKLGNG
jgi:hypothetical protein